MQSLIPINCNGDRQTTSARALWGFLERPYSQFTKWFDQYKDYGFNENHDYRAISEKFLTAQGNESTRTDYEITVDMAKELAMLQKTEKGKQARQYFLELEKQWNTPEAIMARAVKLADKKIIALQGAVEVLQDENDILAQQRLTWANRKVIEAMVKKYGGSVGYDVAWREFKKELLYAHGINLNLRITNYLNSTGKRTKPKTLDMIHDDEVPACLSTATALCRNNGIDVSDIIEKFKKL